MPVDRVALTPDFHKGSGIPIGTVLATQGFVVPQAVGNDINCGMRLHTTSLSEAQVRPKRDQLEKSLRHLFFQGGRNIPMTAQQRQALCQEGLLGLLSAVPSRQQEGLWRLFHQLDIETSLERVHGLGSLPARPLPGLSGYHGQPRRRCRAPVVSKVLGLNVVKKDVCVSETLNWSSGNIKSAGSP